MKNQKLVANAEENANTKLVIEQINSVGTRSKVFETHPAIS
jgi:hypothetical protein